MRNKLALLLLTLLFLGGTDADRPAWSQDDDPFGSSTQSTEPASGAPDEHATTNRIDVIAVGRLESERRILALMGDETSVRFIDTPLVQALESVSEIHDIPIFIDRRALEEVGLTEDAPVNIDVKEISLRSALRLMLRDLDLTYVIKDEVLQITTIESAEQNLVTRMYRLPDNLMRKTSQIIEAIQMSVVPKTWSTHGGPSFAFPLDHVLIVSTTSVVHDDVESFLNTLVAAYDR